MSEATPSEDKSNQFSFIIHTISLLMLVLLPPLIMPSIIRIVALLFSVDLSGLPGTAMTILFQILLLLSYLYMSSRTQKWAIDRESLSSHGVGWSLRTWLLGYGVVVIVALIISSFFTSSNNNQSVYDNLVSGPKDIYLLLLTAVILAPLVEELTFRKFLMDRLEFHLSGKATIFLSALLFSMLHWLNDFLGSSPGFTASHIFSTFILGLILGYIYQQTGNVIYSMIVHAVNNFLGFIGLIITLLFPVTNEEFNLYAQGQSSQLSQTTLQNIHVIIITNFVLIAIGGIALLWGIVRLIRFRHQYYANLKEGIWIFISLFQPELIYGVLYGVFSFILLPWLFILAFEGSSSLILRNIADMLGYVIIVAIAYYNVYMRPSLTQ